MRAKAAEVSAQDLARYLEAEVTASEGAAIAAALADSAEAGRRLRELERLRGALREPPPSLAKVDLVASVGRAIDELDRAPRPARRARWPFAALAAAVVSVLGAATLAFAPRGESEFRAKGIAPAGAEAGRFANVVAYSVDAQGVPARLEATLPRGRGLVFSYTNLGPKPFEYLMIFGVDATGEVRWFHPAYQDARQNPASVAIQPGQASASLGELVTHELPPGTLTLHALFTQQPMHVVEIEALARQGGAATLAALPGAFDRVLTTQVTP